MTGSEFLFYMMSLKGKHLNKKDISSLFEKVELNVSMKAKIKTYSFGMKKKIAIAQAIMEKPDVILLDEPTNSLDEASVEAMRQIILEEKERGATILIASHNKDDLRLLCDKIFKIDEGKICGEIKL